MAKVDKLDRLEAQADSDEEDQFLMPVGLVRGRSVGLGKRSDFATSSGLSRRR